MLHNIIIKFIVAVDENNGIGYDNKMLFHVPNDLKYFKNTTWGGLVVMGRKTFESLPQKLKGRKYIVMTHTPLKNNLTEPNVAYVTSVNEAADIAKKLGYKEIFIIGGRMIYDLFLPFIDEIHITHIYQKHPHPDTFFTTIDWQQFTKIKSVIYDDANIYPILHRIETWKKI